MLGYVCGFQYFLSFFFSFLCAFSVIFFPTVEEDEKHAGLLVLEDRLTESAADGESCRSIVYNNPYLSLSIQQQRARLPIFKASCFALL